MVATFSLGPALTLVTVGVGAAWGAGRLLKASSGRFRSLARQTPYFSSGLLILVGLFLLPDVAVSHREFLTSPENLPAAGLNRNSTTPMNTHGPVAESGRPKLWFEALVVVGLAAIMFGGVEVAAQWRQPLRQAVDIDLSVWALPKYALLSLARGWIAYFFSLLFTLLVASWAFYNLRARRYLLPALDVLQSIPVLGFLPGLVLALVGLFPHSNTGLELACVVMIFTGQVWNMTFSYYDSLRGVPADYRMLGQLYGFKWWHRFLKIELPFGAQGLLYNSMVSMAGGWFFLSITEAFRLGDQDFRVPGIGSYMSVAIERGDVRAQLLGVVAMGVVILVVDRLVWWPLVVWSRKFKLDDFGTGVTEQSGLSRWLARSRATQAFARSFGRIFDRLIPAPKPPGQDRAPAATAAGASNGIARGFYYLMIAVLLGALAWGALRLVLLLSHVAASDWWEILRCTGLSFLRVLVAVALGTLWTVPVGVWIGLNPKLSSRLQPFIQFVASFPAPMIFPWILAVVLVVGGSLQWGAVPLIMMGTQWYILFNVAAAASAVPNDMICCAELLRLSGWRRWRQFLLPAIFPGLVTGWITAAGGAWNATIVSEYVQVGNKLYQATGLGAFISRATNTGNFSQLSAAVLVMAVVVVGINRTLWKPLQQLANERCRFIT
ncbi:MAG: ABC transporter permease subunit [Opitutaceae bacterium]